jgi:DNA-binding NarL/FixJ family response regulator
MGEYRDAAKAAGAVGYVVKTSMHRDLIPAIKAVLESKTADTL